MSKKLILALLISVDCAAKELVVWNVGQGQWITQINTDSCLHFDMGGEKNPSFQIWKLCSKKMNFIHLSHWDWDHVSFLKHFSSKLQRVCLISPRSQPPSPKKSKLIEYLTICSLQETKLIEGLIQFVYQASPKSQGNEASSVVFSRDFHAVIPGDSPKKQEKIWSEKIPGGTQGLILGHHGSSTSTSKELLSKLRKLKWAAVSARQSRYGHPHQKVVEALKLKKVPLLKTEDWGHLHFIKNEKTKNY